MNVAIRDQTERILADLEEKFSQKKSKDNAIDNAGYRERRRDLLPQRSTGFQKYFAQERE
jgi:hypothetical protein